MLIDQFHNYFKVKADKSNTLQYASWLAEEIDYWLNVAIQTFVKTRYSGNNSKQEGFEQTQKRIEDLRTLVVENSIQAYKDDTLTNKDNSYIADLPSNYLFEIGEEVTIGYKAQGGTVTRYTTTGVLPAGYYIVNTGSITYSAIQYLAGEIFYSDGSNPTTISSASVEAVTLKRQGVYNSTADSFIRDIENPFSEYKLHYTKAKPIRLFRSDYVELVTDTEYGVYRYHLRYLRTPAKVSFFTQSVTTVIDDALTQYKVVAAVGSSITYNSTVYTNGQIFTSVAGQTTFTITGNAVLYIRTECDLPEQTHEEILTLAVKMAFANTENTQQYQLTSAEIQQME